MPRTCGGASRHQSRQEAAGDGRHEPVCSSARADGAGHDDNRLRKRGIPGLYHHRSRAQGENEHRRPWCASDNFNSRSESPQDAAGRAGARDWHGRNHAFTRIFSIQSRFAHHRRTGHRIVADPVGAYRPRGFLRQQHGEPRQDAGGKHHVGAGIRQCAPRPGARDVGSDLRVPPRIAWNEQCPDAADGHGIQPARRAREIPRARGGDARSPAWRRGRA